MKVSSVLTTVLFVILSLPFAASANDKGVVLVTGANRGLGLEFVTQLQGFLKLREFLRFATLAMSEANLTFLELFLHRGRELTVFATLFISLTS